MKVFYASETVPVKVHPAKAYNLLKSGMFVGFGSPTRVKTLREYDQRPPAPWVDCWRTSEACVLPAWSAR